MTKSETAKFLRKISGGKYTVEVYADHESWLNGRMNGIGASEAAAVLGKSPWMNERQLWERKKSPVAESGGNADTLRGHLSEEHIRELYAIETNQEVLDGTNIILRSVEHPFMTASLDGIIVHREPPCSMAEPIIASILEIKSVRNGGNEWTDDTMPNYYILQVLHQLAVTGWMDAKLLARFCRTYSWPKAYEREYLVRTCDYHDAIDKLIQKEQKFWEWNVVGNHVPRVSLPEL